MLFWIRQLKNHLQKSSLTLRKPFPCRRLRLDALTPKIPIIQNQSGLAMFILVTGISFLMVAGGVSIYNISSQQTQKIATITVKRIESNSGYQQALIKISNAKAEIQAGGDMNTIYRREFNCWNPDPAANDNNPGAKTEGNYRYTCEDHSQSANSKGYLVKVETLANNKVVGETKLFVRAQAAASLDCEGDDKLALEDPNILGQGTEASPYILCTAKQLNNIGNVNYNTGKVPNYTQRRKVYYSIGKDIDLSTIDTDDFHPISLESGSGFDGKGYTLSNLTLTPGTSGNQKTFFGSISNITTPTVPLIVKNIIIKNFDFSVGRTVGLLAGDSRYGTFEKIKIIDSKIKCTSTCGGLVGLNLGGAISNVSVSNTSIEGGSEIGGIVGTLSGEGKILKSSASVTIFSTSNRIGGLVGYANQAEISENFAKGSVIGRNDVGGLVGFSTRSNIHDNYSWSSIDDSTTSPGMGGGFVGTLGSVSGVGNTTKNNYSTGTVRSDWNASGFLAQIASGTTSNNFSVGDVISAGQSGSKSGPFTIAGVTATLTDNYYWSGSICKNGNSDCKDLATPVGIAEINSSKFQGQLGETLNGKSAVFSTWKFSGTEADPAIWKFPGLGGYPILAWEKDPCSGERLQNILPFAGGTGTVEDPYLICTAEQLNEIGKAVSTPSSYKLMADIDLQGITFNMIHLNGGVFYGNQKVIKNLVLTTSGSASAGLFKKIKNGEVNNLTIKDASVTSTSGSDSEGAGILVGVNDGGIIKNCSSTGVIQGKKNVGGLIGLNLGRQYFNEFQIDSVSSEAQVSGENYVGGLIGNLKANAVGKIIKIQNANATGNVTGSQWNTGGLVGGVDVNNNASITVPHIIQNVFTSGNVVGKNSTGGLIGTLLMASSLLIADSHTTGSITGSGQASGGLIGKIEGNGFKDLSIEKVYATGGVTSQSYSGGLIGYHYQFNSGGNTTIKKSYASGNIHSTHGSSSGLIGHIIMGGTKSSLNLNEVYATGAATFGDATTGNESSGVGGLIGRFDHNSSNSIFKIENAYSKSNLTSSYGGNVSAGGLVGWVTGGGDSTFKNTYSKGSVSALNNHGKGGLIGSLSSPAVTSSYWDVETSGLGTDEGTSGSSGGIGKTTAKMQTQSTFTNAGWDFTNVWKMPNIPGYPIFQWQKDPCESLTLTVPPFGGGTGTPEDPYRICTTAQFNGISGSAYTGKSYALMTSLSGASTMPKLSNGYFEGNGHTINFNYNGSSSSNVGLFSEIQNAEIRNLKVLGNITSSYTYSNHWVGGIVGRMTASKITNTSFEGNIKSTSTSSNSWTGGLIGYIYDYSSDKSEYSEIKNSYFKGKVDGSEETGGLIGHFGSNGLIDSSYSEGTITALKGPVGGLIGRTNEKSKIQNSYSLANVTGGSGSGNIFTGGLVGSNSGTIEKSYATGTVTGGLATSGNTFTGGLVGSFNGTINESFASGQVIAGKANSSNQMTGGLIGTGSSEAEIFNSYSSGKVNGGDGKINVFTGGFIGGSSNTIQNSYSISEVTSGIGTNNAFTGGFAGTLSGIVQNSYSAGKIIGRTGTEDIGGFCPHNYSSNESKNIFSTSDIVKENPTTNVPRVSRLIKGYYSDKISDAYYWSGSICEFGVCTSDGTAVTTKPDFFDKNNPVYNGTPAWNFSTIWKMPPAGFNNGYPIHQWCKPNLSTGLCDFN